jgi:hypothetical protein
LVEAAQFNPAVFDRYDVEDAIQDRNLLRGFPAKHIRGDAEVREIRKERQQAEQAQMQRQQAMENVQAAQTASQINTQPGNAVGDAVNG